ncbi:Aste57867_16002 [Aphanomyces stellatus]|uniref:non-specific serine/threonine protein kinase n=1 Tax=Aphanomyces stellatus TaxID=120398 RepID=A0A485L504_9STRA|nr:hypothetical protein As57867_015946 [Aphanomyces stellatus]VFT92787.1 Aste57867_16002 [Aphanomyces stellatus]
MLLALSAALADRMTTTAQAASCSVAKTTLTQKCGHVFVTKEKDRVCPYSPAKCVPLNAGECFDSTGSVAYEDEMKCPYDDTKCVAATPATLSSVFAKVDDDNRDASDFSPDTRSYMEEGKFCFNASKADRGFVVFSRWTSQKANKDFSARSCVVSTNCVATAFSSSVKTVQVLNDFNWVADSITFAVNLDQLGDDLSVDAFNASTKTTFLTLRGNQLTTLGRTKFPASLQWLDVSTNKLTALDNLDKNAPGLQQLLAMGNAIVSIDTAVFPSSFYQLSLQNNAIKHINGSALPAQLSSLYLNFNQVARIDGVLSANLTTLNLDTNQLAAFDGSVLDPKQTMLSLNLQNNPIQALNGTFPSTLKAIILSNTKLTAFPDVAFKGMKANIVNLASNNFEWTASSPFPGNMTDLNMSSTPVQGTVLNASALPRTLVSLDVSNCRISRIDGDFPPSLATLRLDRNAVGTWTMSNKQLAFLTSIKSLTLPDSPMNATCPAAAQQRINGTYVVCIKEVADLVTPSPTTASSSGHGTAVTVIIGGIALLTLLGLGYFLYRRRHVDVDSSRSLMIETCKVPRLEHYTGKGVVASATARPDDDESSLMMVDTLERISLGDDLLQYRIPLHEVKILKPLTPERGDAFASSDLSSAFAQNKVMLYKAQFNDQLVVLKTLTTDGTHISAEAEAFVEGIRLRATLQHPNIVGLVGVVWSTNVRKGIVGYGVLLEHLGHGDLARVLAFDATKDAPDRLLQWRPRNPALRPKLALAVDIASAIVYLHSFSPALVHRNIHSKTVLLGDKWEAKLSGIKANPAWQASELVTAPEVLKGESWTEKADIYAFGILLCELDLGRHPYMQAKEEADSNKQIATLVMADLLQPTFSADCPLEVQDIARKCLSFEKKERPTAVQMEFWLRKARRAINGE